LEGPNGLLIEQALRFAFKASNNQAEYEVLIAGMLLAKEMGAKSLLAKSDSLLVTSQVIGGYQAKDPQMVAYLEYVQILRETFEMFELEHVPREHNARADLLTKLASSGKGGRQMTVIQETLRTSRTTTDNAAEIHQISTSEGVKSLTHEMLKTPRISTHLTNATWLMGYSRWSPQKPEKFEQVHLD